MRKGWMNSYAKFGGAARRHFSAICEKPMGGHICAPPPAVRGLKLDGINFFVILDDNRRGCDPRFWLLIKLKIQ